MGQLRRLCCLRVAAAWWAAWRSAVAILGAAQGPWAARTLAPAPAAAAVLCQSPPAPSARLHGAGLLALASTVQGTAAGSVAPAPLVCQPPPASSPAARLHGAVHESGGPGAGHVSGHGGGAFQAAVTANTETL